MNNKQPILLTGSHRSGSTWIGKMIGESKEVCYIQEPFNLNHRPGVCSAKFENWFTYINEENEIFYNDHIKKTLRFKYHFLDELKSVQSPYDIKRMLNDYINFSLARFRGSRPLFKDPIAFFSADWLAKKHNFQVIVLIRHPAAFASSIKRVNSPHPFAHFLRQNALMRDHLKTFEKEIEEYAYHPPGMIDQAILLWKIIHSVIYKYMRKNRDWIFIRHEDISIDPLKGFRDLFQKLGLQYTEKIEKVIQEHASPKNPTEGMGGRRFILRNSKSNVLKWKKSLTENEIDRIKLGVKGLSEKFYAENAW